MELTLKNCPDCGVKTGEIHKNGCDIEQCPECGGQLFSCDHKAIEKERLIWTGELPGYKECIEFGWYVKPKGKDFELCDKNDTEAIPNLNRLHYPKDPELRDVLWNKEKKRFVLRG